jgi:hypothetical protein
MPSKERAFEPQNLEAARKSVVLKCIDIRKALTTRESVNNADKDHRLYDYCVPVLRKLVAKVPVRELLPFLTLASVLRAQVHLGERRGSKVEDISHFHEIAPSASCAHQA